MRKLHLVLGLTLILHVAVATSGVLSAEPERGTAAAFSRRLEELDRRLQVRLRRVADQAAAGQAADPSLGGEAERLRAELAAVEHDVRRQHDGDPAALLAKLRELDNLLANLERAAGTGTSTAVLPESGRRLSQPVAATAASDDCADALVIGFGLRTGDTSGATNDAQASCGASTFSPDVWFKYVAETSGSVYADTFGSAYDTVLSVHTECPGTIDNERVCNDDAFGLQSAVGFYAYSGNEYRIRVSGFNEAAGPFQLRLGSGGGISGTVSDRATGTPLPDGRIEAWYSEGYYAGSTRTGAAGEYTLGSLGSGSFFVSTEDFGSYLDELYDDSPCPGGPPYGCDLASGTPVAVLSDGIVPNVDFALDAGGAVTGGVSDAAGAPIPGLRVEIYDSDGDQVATGCTDVDGSYLVDGLAAGDYFVSAESSDYADELFDDFPCPGGAPYGCDPTTGTPVKVALGATAAGIDFALDRLGAVSGVVTDAVTGEPIPSLQVELYSSAGSWVDYGYTDSTGTYTVAGLAPGTYFARTDSYAYVNEVYDDLACCDVTTGTPIDVVINQTTTGIDFVLDQRGAVSGTVTDAVTGDPIRSVEVQVYNSGGGWVDYEYTDASGRYTVTRLAAGTYFARASTYYSDHLGELYEELPCEGGCDPTLGTPIAVANNKTTVGIDFTLDQGGIVTGTVTDSSGNPAYGVEVKIWDATGSSVRYTSTDSAGDYAVQGITTGTYFVTTESNDFLDELYDGFPCESTCDPTAGTPVEVVVNQTSAGIDFILERLGAVSGTVTDATGGAIRYHRVEIWDDAGSFVGSDDTDSSGDFTVGGLAAGTYFAITDDYGDYVDELYDDLPCEPSCDPTAGTPIAVSLGQTAGGVDFVLRRLGAISGTVTDTAGAPIGWFDVKIWDATGSFFDYAYTDSSGLYTTGGLPPGTYFVSVESYYGDYVDELYDDLPCEPSCDPTTGTPIAVGVDQTTAGIDFVLDTPGALSGVILDQDTGNPLANVEVEVWNSGGERVRVGVSDSAGIYTVSRLAPGTYYVATRNDGGYLDELYDDIPCPGGGDSGCDPTKGSPVPVTVNATTRHVNFALGRFATGPGSLSGTVTDEDSGGPLASVFIDVWDTGGERIATTVTNSSGGYRLRLDAGTYFVSTDNGYGFVDEVFDGVYCYSGPASAGGCDPALGTPVTVDAEVVTGIDFALGPGYLFYDGFESGDLTAWSSSSP